MNRFVKSKRNNIYVVENIVDVRMKRGEKEYLIKWEGYPDTENTWEPESNVQDEELISDFETARYASGDSLGQKTPRSRSRTAKKRESTSFSIGVRSNRSSGIRASSVAIPLTPRRGRARESIMVTPSVSPGIHGPVLFRRKTNNSTGTSLDADSTLEDDGECSAMDTTIEDAVEESGMDEEVANFTSEETSAAEHMLQIKFVFFKLVEYLILFFLFSFFLSFRHP